MLLCVWNMTRWFKIYDVVQSLSHVWLFAIPWTAACQASLSITNSQSLPKRMSTESVMPSNYLIFCCPLLLLPSIFPSIRVFSNESALHIRWQSIGASAQKCIQNTKTKNDQGGRPGFDLWVGKIPWRSAWQPTPVFLPGESPWREELGGL